ncbi:MAG: Crp/Fnr family transcriptional regulator [Bacteroidota bacterium]
MEKLRTALSFGGILNDTEIDYILPQYEYRVFQIGEEFLQIGRVSRSIGFIDEGIMRAYAIGLNGEEVTKYFMRPNQFLVDLESYYNDTPAENAIQAITASHLYIMHRSTWITISQKIPKLYILMKSLTEAALMSKIKDNDFLNFGTAKDKYQAFVERYPQLALQVPQQYIASYLKITPQSLSRIRRELTK